MENENYNLFFQSNCEKIKQILTECISGEIDVHINVPWKCIHINIRQSGYCGNMNVLCLLKNLQNYFNLVNGTSMVSYHQDVNYPTRNNIKVGEGIDKVGLVETYIINRDITITFTDFCFNALFTTLEKGQKFFDSLIAVLRLFCNNPKDTKESGNPNLP